MGLQPQGRRTTPIAHLLTIDSWSRRRKIVERVRAACTVVSAVDHRYDLTVEAAISDRGNYVLHCRRSSPAAAAASDSQIAPEVGAAWHATSPRRRPSAKQLEILRGLVAEWGVTPVVDALSAASGAGDPFAELLGRVAVWRERRESAWEESKADENSTAPDVLQKIREGVARRAAVSASPTGEARRGPASIGELLGELR
jgi:hypothetical protein